MILRRRTRILEAVTRKLELSCVKEKWVISFLLKGKCMSLVFGEQTVD